MRSCIFCGGPANSKEDAWPSWLMRQLGATSAGIVEAQRGRQAPRTWRASGLRIGCVCTICNNGWMSILEERVKPIVESLFGEESVILNNADQLALSVWAGKNAMVYEALRLEPSWFYTNSDRWTLREALRVPPSTSIWIAKCVEHHGVFCKASDLGGVAGSSRAQVKAHVTTMGFGSLAIQVLSVQLPSSSQPDIKVTADPRTGPWDQATIQIWPDPSEAITWPALIGLSGELGLDTLSKRWNTTNT